MKGTRAYVVVVSMVVAVAVLAGGCGGSLRGRSVDKGQWALVAPDLYQKGEGDEALWRYVNPKANVKAYKKVIINPVLVTKGGELDAKERENYQALASNAWLYLKEELGKSYEVVTAPGPDVLEVQMAILDAQRSKDVTNTMSTFAPPAVAVSTLKYAVTGKPLGVGEITCEMKITDSSTGALLGAALDRRVGGKQLAKLWSDWNNADDALKYWAKRVAYVLCDMRGGKDCVKP